MNNDALLLTIARAARITKSGPRGVTLTMTLTHDQADALMAVAQDSR